MEDGAQRNSTNSDASEEKSNLVHAAAGQLSNLAIAESPTNTDTITSIQQSEDDTALVTAKNFAEIAKRCDQARQDGWSLPDLETCIQCAQAVLKANTVNPDSPQHELAQRNRLAALYNLSSFYGLQYRHSQEPSCLTNVITTTEDALMALAALDPSISQPSTHKTKQELFSKLITTSIFWHMRTGDLPPRVRDGIFDTNRDDSSKGGIGTPEYASYLFALAGGLADANAKDASDPASIPVPILELSVSLAYEALDATTPHHPQWEKIVHAARRWQRVWSEKTGKMPDTEIATILLAHGARWVPWEMEGIPDMEWPFYVSVGDLNAPKGQQPVVMPMMMRRNPDGRRKENFISS